MSIVKKDIDNLKSDIQNLHEDLKEAMDHLEYHLGVKRMDENDLKKMSKHLADVDQHMAKLLADADALGEKHG